MDLVKLGSVTWISSCLCVQNNKIIMYLCTLILLSSDDCADKIFASAFRDQFTKGLIRKEFINKFKKKRKEKEKLGTCMFYAHSRYTYYCGLM